VVDSDAFQISNCAVEEREQASRSGADGEGNRLISPRSQYSHEAGVIIKSEEISLTSAFSALVVLGGIAFQFGYFREVGFEFAPHISVWDIFFPLAASLSYFASLLLILVPIYYIIEWRFNKVYQFSPIHHATNYAFLFTGILILIMIYDYFVLGDPMIAGNLAIKSILYFCATVMLVLAMKNEYNEYSHISAKLFIWFAIVMIVSMINIGEYYIKFMAGKECYFRTVDTHIWQGRYLRALGDGHLVRIKDAIIFISKDAVREISCGRNIPQKDAIPSDVGI
jgi:hypothetical protein